MQECQNMFVDLGKDTIGCKSEGTEPIVMVINDTMVTFYGCPEHFEKMRDFLRNIAYKTVALKNAGIDEKTAEETIKQQMRKELTHDALEQFLKRINGHDNKS